MRAFLAFTGLLFGALVVAALVAYPLYAGLHGILDYPFHRYVRRLATILIALGLVVLLRRLRIANRRALGYGLPAPLFLRRAGVAYVLGIASLVPVAAFLLLSGVRDVVPGALPDAGAVVLAFLDCALTGVLVALMEETLIRGALFTAMERESGVRLAIALPSVLYAASHFIAKVKIPHEQVTWSSGFDVIAGMFSMFADFGRIADSFLALCAVGVLLGLLRARTGNIAACIGLHAGWVTLIQFVHRFSAGDPAAPLAWTVGSYDGFIGWLVLAWSVLIIAAVALWYAPPRRE